MLLGTSARFISAIGATTIIAVVFPSAGWTDTKLPVNSAVRTSTNASFVSGSHAAAKRRPSSAPACSGRGSGSFVGINNANVAHGTQSAVVGGTANDVCDSLSAIVGGSDNVVESGADHSFIGGGALNVTASEDSAIIAGSQNQIAENDLFSSIVGGLENQIASNSDGAFIAGGFANAVSLGSSLSTIVGGQANSVDGYASSIVGGYQNVISYSGVATLIGGENNTVTGAPFAVLGGGYKNALGGYYASIVSGYSNSVAGEASATVGGEYNVSQARGDFIGSGYDNQIKATSAGGGNASADAVISGGSDNTITALLTNGGYWGSVGGGSHNTVTGMGATIPGGVQNVAAGVDSFAAGTASYAKHDGSFVFSDDAAGAKQLVTTGINQFLVRASGGVALYSNAALASGVVLRAGSGSWASLSDRASKTDIRAVDSKAVLAKIAALPVSEWSYRTENPAIRHVGPMAQDFYAAFGVGADDRHITSIDEEGIALAAIQALNAKNAALEARVRQLALRDARLESAVAALLARQER